MMRFPILLTFVWLIDSTRAEVRKDILKDVETTLKNIAGQLNQDVQNLVENRKKTKRFFVPLFSSHSSGTAVNNYGQVTLVGNQFDGQVNIGKKDIHTPSQHSKLDFQNLAKNRKKTKRFFVPLFSSHSSDAAVVNYGQVTLVGNQFGGQVNIGKKDIHTPSQHSKLNFQCPEENKKETKRTFFPLLSTHHQDSEVVNNGEVNLVCNQFFGTVNIGKRDIRQSQYSQNPEQKAEYREYYQPHQQSAHSVHHGSVPNSYQPPPQSAQNVNYGSVYIGNNYGTIGKRTLMDLLHVSYRKAHPQTMGTQQHHHHKHNGTHTHHGVTEEATAQTTETPQPTQLSRTHNHRPHAVVYLNNYGPIG